MDDQEPEVGLPGGVANQGKVVRIGDTVHRPSTPQSPLVQDFLGHLRSTGIRWVPEPLGFDGAGREVLSWMPGQAAGSLLRTTDHGAEMLDHVARHQRELHEAARSYTAPTGPWADTAGDYFPPRALNSAHGTTLVCHNDLGPANVIITTSSPDSTRGPGANQTEPMITGVIDFDYLRPVDPLFDIAVAARHWTPLGPPSDDAPSIDERIERFRRFMAAHQLTLQQRRDVVTLTVAFLEHARLNVTALAEAGQPGFVQLLESGYLTTNAQTIEWTLRHGHQLSS